MSPKLPEVDPYESSDTTEFSLEQRLIAEENIVGTILGSIVGAIPGFTVFVLLVGLDYFAYLAYVIPGVMVGLFASFMGRGIRKKHNLVAAAITFLFVLAIHWFFHLPAASIWLSQINVVMAGALAGRRLNREQSDAVFDYKIGLKRTKE